MREFKPIPLDADEKTVEDHAQNWREKVENFLTEEQQEVLRSPRVKEPIIALPPAIWPTVQISLLQQFARTDGGNSLCLRLSTCLLTNDHALLALGFPALISFASPTT